MSQKIRFRWIAACAFLALVLPSVAAACPVCIDQNSASRGAYFDTTILLSLLPLAFIGGTALYIRARLVAQSEEDYPVAATASQEPA